MYAIYLKSRKEPVVVEDRIGQRVKERWAAFKQGIEKKGDIVQLDEVSFEVSSIKVIEGKYVPDTTDNDMEVRRNTGVDMMREEGAKFTKHWLQQVELPARQKALNLMLPQMMWYSHTGSNDIPEEIAAGIVILQEIFFEENPRCIYANPICYKDLMPQKKNVADTSMLSIARGLRDHALVIVERCIIGDYREQKYNHA